MKQAKFYHAGCSVCVTAESSVVNALDRTKYAVESVDVGQHKERIAEAEAAGVKTLPALVLDGTPFHINFGANLDDVK